MSDLSVLDEFDAVLPVGRKLTETERREIQEIQDRIRQDGKLYAVDAAGNSLRDAAGQPITRDYQVVRGKRFMVDAHGVLWRFFPRGGPKDRRGIAARRCGRSSGGLASIISAAGQHTQRGP